MRIKATKIVWPLCEGRVCQYLKKEMSKIALNGVIAFYKCVQVPRKSIFASWPNGDITEPHFMNQ
jgi:hypothetical protein